ncbi:hypothetical protein B0H14DRAFT_3105859 [Mycena olivaceomarginata]|nr:hypothetical protein B0H14DRAFT_3105859 [Mycena olivaceomarginata]
MNFRAVFDIFDRMRVALKIGVPAALRAIMASPSLLLNLDALSRISMANIWILFGAGGDEAFRADKKMLITSPCPWCHGHTVNYLDRSAVTKYVALEPNTLMHSRIRQMASAAGYTESDGTLLILSCGAEDTASILSSVHTPVDTIVSVLTLCTVPFPQQTIRTLVLDILTPNGVLLFIEHVRRDRVDAAWQLIDDDGVTPWTKQKIWNPINSKESLFWLQVGHFVKK